MNPHTLSLFRRMVLGVAACSLFPSMVGDPLKGGNFSLTGVPTGGGGRTGGGSFSVDGSVGQPSTTSSSGGGYQVTGGLLGIVVIPGEVVVTIEKTGDGKARLTWPSGTVGFQLQFSPQLGSQPDWKPVEPAPTGNVFITPIDQPLRFFRLHKP